LLYDLLNYTKIVADSNAKKKIYTVLLVLTCGQIHDFQKTIDLIATGKDKLSNKFPAQKSAISVVIVGIGEFDFKKMERLDQD
jgi:phosphoribosylformylglycinamidine (FGAM) synthase-like enzyme